MSALYVAARTRFLTAALDWTTADLKVMLLGPDYTPNYVTHTTVADIPGGSRLTTPIALVNPTVVAGVASSDNPFWDSLLLTDYLTSAVIIEDNAGDIETFPLVALITDGDGFGVAPANEDVQLLWDAVYGGIFSL